MESSQHQGHGSAMRRADDVGLRNTLGIHKVDQSAGSCDQADVQVGNPIGITDSQRVRGIHGRGSGQPLRRWSPGVCGAQQAVQEQQGRSVAGDETTHPSALHPDELFVLSRFP